MMKKVLVKALAAFLSITLLGGCGTAAPASESPKASSEATPGTQTPEAERKDLEYNALFVISKERIPDDPSLLDEVMKEKFGIVMKWEQIASSSVAEKLNLLYASRDIPDMVWPVGVTSDYPKRYGRDGLLLPINEYFDKLPNYRALYSDSDWETLLVTQSNADGNLYYLPQKNYRDTSNAWIYRKSAFDELGLTFPKTIDELYTVLKTIKEKYPDSIPMPNQGGLDVVNGLSYAFGIDPLSPYCFIDEDGQLVSYSRTTDEYREVLKFASKLWAEGLINKEFATVTEQQWTESYANGKTYIQYLYATRETWAEENMKAVDPDVDWAWVPYNITADPSGAYYFNREAPYTTAGPFFSETIKGEKMDRMMEWYDWLCTEEGSRFICMGEEGVTYELVNNEPQFMSHMYHSERNPDGKKDWSYGLYLGNIVQHPAYLKEVGKTTDLDLSAQLMADTNSHYFPIIAWNFSEADEKKINDYDTVIKDVTEEYSMKFIMGNLDPNSDADWEAYLKVLDGVGLKEAKALREANYKTN